MTHEENKNHQPETADFSIENFLTDEKKQPSTGQQVVTNRNDFAKPGDPLVISRKITLRNFSLIPLDHRRIGLH